MFRIGRLAFFLVLLGVSYLAIRLRLRPRLGTFVPRWREDDDGNKGREEDIGHITIVTADGRRDLTWLASASQKKSYAKQRGYGFDFDQLDFSLLDANQGWEQLRKDMEQGNGEWKEIKDENTEDNNFEARIRDKQTWHVEGEYRAFFVDTWAKVVVDGARVFTPDHLHQPFGWMPGTWNKVVGIRNAMDRVSRDTWLWSIDSDVIITDMNSVAPSDIVREANAEGADIVSAEPWECGDGLNVGSIMIKNSEYGRAFIDRMLDSRAVWHQFYIGEQGAVWVLLGNDEDVGRRWKYVRPRQINARPPECGCADHEPDGERLKERVYWREGDFVAHLAGIKGREALARKLLNATGGWPAPRPDVAPMFPRATPVLTHVAGLGSPFDLQRTRALVVGQRDGPSPPRVVTIGGTDVPTTYFVEAAYSNTGHTVNTRDKEALRFLNDDSGWAKVVAVRSQLDTNAAAPPRDWIVVASSADEAAAFVEKKALGAAVRLKDAHVAVDGDDCATPWLVRDGEYSRNLFLRLRDGWLLRAARMGVMQIEGRDEEWGSGAVAALCALARRNPSSVLPWIAFL